MKQFIFSLFIVVSSFISFSQVIDFNNIDYKKLNEKIFNKINDHRISLGLDSLFYSNVIESTISKPNMGKMISEKRMFHPGYSISDKNFIFDLSAEYKKSSDNKCFNSNPIMEFIGANGEIICGVMQSNITYDDVAELSLEGWLASPPHKKIMETSYKNFNGCSGLGSCQVCKVGDKFFVIFNFIQLNYL